jgi:hypothetical protein
MFNTKKPRPIVISRKQLNSIHPSWLKDPRFIRHLMPTPRNSKTA